MLSALNGLGVGFLLMMQVFVYDLAVQEPEKEPKAVLSVSQPVIEIEGHYLIQGSTAQNEYEGLLTVTKQDEIYIFRWNIEGAIGLGIRENNTIAVGMKGNNSLGTLLYRVEKDNGKPKLVGRWASSPGDGKVHEETATWLRGLK